MEILHGGTESITRLLPAQPAPPPPPPTPLPLAPRLASPLNWLFGLAVRLSRWDCCEVIPESRWCVSRAPPSTTYFFSTCHAPMQVSAVYCLEAVPEVTKSFHVCFFPPLRASIKRMSCFSFHGAVAPSLARVFRDEHEFIFFEPVRFC